MLDPDLFPFFKLWLSKDAVSFTSKIYRIYKKKKWNEKSDYKSHRATAFINIWFLLQIKKENYWTCVKTANVLDIV